MFQDIYACRARADDGNSVQPLYSDWPPMRATTALGRRSVEHRHQAEVPVPAESVRRLVREPVDFNRKWQIYEEDQPSAIGTSGALILVFILMAKRVAASHDRR